MKRPYRLTVCYSLLLALLTACTLGEPTQNRAAELALSASVTEGAAPLEVTFTTAVTVGGATANARDYAWTVAGAAQAETTPALTYIFDAPGVYVVTAMADTNFGSVSDSVSVSVTQADTTPEDPSEPGEGTFSVTQTPGGPAPWAVRYTVQLEGYGAGAQFRVRCADEDTRYLEEEGEESVVCLHTKADERARVEVVLGGEVVDSTEVASEVTPPRDGVAFLGEWRYDSRGLSETFAITRGTPTAGESEAGFELFLIELDGRDIAEFTFGGRTVVLSPTPDADGAQVFFADVYGLRLERLD